MNGSTHDSPRLILAERLTLAVLLSGVAALALSDFVSPFYWGVVALVSAFRLWYGPRFSLTEMQASMIGWTGFLWVALELLLGRALVVAFTDFLLILSLAIVIEEATPRNHLHRMLVGFFLILGGAVLTDSVLYVLPLAAFMWFTWRASHCLYGMNLPGGDLPVSRWQSDVRVMISMGVTTAVLFMVLPRFDFHSYLKPQQPRMQTSGFSDKVELGDFASTLDATVVMRVEPLAGDKQSFRKQMRGHYWRGVALSRFNGRGWEKTQEKALRRWSKGSDITLLSRRRGVPFAVYRESSDHRYLIVPENVGEITDLPDTISGGDQGGFRFGRAPDRRLRIIMQLGEGERGLQLLRKPDAAEKEQGTVPVAISRWAKEVAGDAPEGSVSIIRLLNELKGWKYDLDAPVDNVDPVSSFLKLKRGHCELYATTLALSARSLGIPSRVVNGYYGGEWNDVGGFYLVRQQHAHSWTEVWLNGRWQRFDATPASRWQLSGVRFPALDEIWESIKLSWYRYVLEFQNSDRVRSWARLIALLKQYAWWFVLTVACVLLLRLLKRSNIRLPRLLPSGGLNATLDRWLAKRGIKRKPHQPVRHLPLPRGVQRSQWKQFVRSWEEQAYGTRGKWSHGELKRHLRAL